MGWLKRLKGTPDTKANDSLLFVEEKRKPVNDLIWPGIRIIRKDQTKRYIDDRYLDPHFHTQAGSVVANTCKQSV